MPSLRIARNKEEAAFKWDRSKCALMVLGLILVAATFAVYFPALHAGFIWDDDDYVTNNQELFSLSGLARIWFDFKATPQYYPLVYTTFCLEYNIWGLSPTGYHLVNIFLHSIVALLLWRLLALLRMPGSWLAAAIFALHPIHVESVAWITERKNVLSGIFYLAAAIMYLKYALVPADGGYRRHRCRWYLAALVLFAGALLSKTVTCTLPAALLLVVWWKRDRLKWQDIYPLIPMFVLSAGAALITAKVEYTNVGAVGADWSHSWIERCLLAGRIAWFYVGKLFWPHPLTFVYPRWQIQLGSWWQYIYPIALLAVLIALWLMRKRFSKGPLTAVLVFVCTLSPTLGFINIYYMRYSFVADHFMYLPSIALIVLAVTAGAVLIKRYSSAVRRAVPLMAVCILLVLAALTWHQSYVYADQEALWRDTLDKNPNAWIAHSNLAVVLIRQGKYDEAIQHCDEAIRLCPTSAKAYTNRGNAYYSLGDDDRCLADYSRAIEIDPNSALAYYNRGAVLCRRKQWNDAITDFTKAIALKKRFIEAFRDRGDAYVQLREYKRAVLDFDKVVALNPGEAKGYSCRGNAYAWLGDFKQAIRDCSKAIELNPDDVGAYSTRASASISLKQYQQAIQDCSRAIALQPDHVMAYNNRAVSFYWLKDYARARADVEKCIQLGGQVAPGFIEALSQAASRPG